MRLMLLNEDVLFCHYMKVWVVPVALLATLGESVVILDCTQYEVSN